MQNNFICLSILLCLNLSIHTNDRQPDDFTSACNAIRAISALNSLPVKKEEKKTNDNALFIKIARVLSEIGK